MEALLSLDGGHLALVSRATVHVGAVGTGECRTLPGGSLLTVDRYAGPWPPGVMGQAVGFR